MNKKDYIDQEVSKTMELLDNQHEIPPNPFFYTRVKARLDKKYKKRNVFSAILKPALFTLLFAINLGTGAWYLSGDQEETQIESRKELIETLSGDLNLDSSHSDIFNLE